jgi:hypothetical protein
MQSMSGLVELVLYCWEHWINLACANTRDIALLQSAITPKFYGIIAPGMSRHDPVVPIEK